MLTLLLSLALLGPNVAKNTHGMSPVATSCENQFHSLLGAMKDPKNDPDVVAETALIVGGTSYAEYLYIPAEPEPCPPNDDDCFRPGDSPHKRGSARPFVVTGSIANASSIGGVSHVAAPPNGTPRSVTFVLFEKDGKARLQWVYQRKRYESAVSSCAGPYWTAATGGSSIAIRLGPVGRAARVPS